MTEYGQYWELNKDAGMWVNNLTGEAIDAPLLYMEPGSEYLSPEEVERRRKFGQVMKKRLEKAEQEQFARHIRTEQERELGQYIFTSADKDAFSDLPADTLARAAFLASYLRFGTDELWKTSRTKMRRLDLQSVMAPLSEATINRFWRAVNGKYFYRDNEGFLHTTGKSFVIGRLKSAPTEEYQKLYVSAIRELYRKILPKQHKRLGFALKMLPYMNFEFNILCENPDEKQRELVTPITVSDFCDIVGIDKEHAPRLAREYGRLTFTVGDMQEVFCKFVYDGRDVGKSEVFINPRLIYKGSNFHKVGAIGISFAASARPIQ